MPAQGLAGRGLGALAWGGPQGPTAAPAVSIAFGGRAARLVKPHGAEPVSWGEALNTRHRYQSSSPPRLPFFYYHLVALGPRCADWRGSKSDHPTKTPAGIGLAAFSNLNHRNIRASLKRTTTMNRNILRRIRPCQPDALAFSGAFFCPAHLYIQRENMRGRTIRMETDERQCFRSSGPVLCR